MEKAGVNGIAIMSIKLLNLISSTRLINPNTFSWFLNFFSTNPLNFRQIKKLRVHPATVESHEIIKPQKFPNAIILIAINKASGSAGIIDSKTIANTPKKTLKNKPIQMGP